MFVSLFLSLCMHIYRLLIHAYIHLYLYRDGRERERESELMRSHVCSEHSSIHGCNVDMAAYHRRRNVDARTICRIRANERAHTFRCFVWFGCRGWLRIPTEGCGCVAGQDFPQTGGFSGGGAAFTIRSPNVRTTVVRSRVFARLRLHRMNCGRGFDDLNSI